MPSLEINEYASEIFNYFRKKLYLRCLVGFRYVSDMLKETFTPCTNIDIHQVVFLFARNSELGLRVTGVERCS